MSQAGARRSALDSPARASEERGLSPQLEPSDFALEARYRELVRAQHEVGTAHWRAWPTVAIVAPLMVLNALFPAFAAGRALSGVSVDASLIAFGAHALLYALACAAFAVFGSAHHRVYRALNRAESIAWVGAAVGLVGLSGSVVSPYWLHCALVVVLTFPMVASHRALLSTLVVATVGVTALLWRTAGPADAAVGAATGATLVAFQALAMRVAPLALRSQARAELVAERSSALLIEADRGRIRRELHDNLGAELTALLWTAERLDADASPEVQTLVHQVRSGISELRVAMHAVSPEPFSPGGLAREVERVTARVAAPRADVRVAVHSEVDGTCVPGDVGVAAIRASQEAVRNAITHGAAGVVEIAIHIDADALELVVRDHGAGRLTRVQPGEGLRGLDARIRALGGSLSVEQRRPSGLIVRARVPLLTPPGP